MEECMSKLKNKREQEKHIVTLMIHLYCKSTHNTQKGLCPECEELNLYAIKRIEKCPFMETKSFCSNCHVHCYTPEMRKRIREVMRFSGPRMIFHHPIMTIRHLKVSLKEKSERMHNYEN